MNTQTTAATEVKVPDIGDFKDVPIIDIHVKVGDPINAEDPLITLESDKATMDVPAPEDGVIGEIRVKVGDKVSQGDLLATYSGERDTKPAEVPQAQKGPAPAAAQGGVEIQEPASKAAAQAAPPPKPAADPGGQADFETDIP